MKATIFLACLILTTIACFAQQTNSTATTAPTNALPTTITIGNIVYEDVRWGTVTPFSVSIFHKSGIAKIPLYSLPPELQKRFGYDPRKGEKYRQAEAQQQAAWQQAEQLRLAKLKQQQAEEEQAKRAAQAQAEKCAGSMLVYAQVTQVLKEGLLLRIICCGKRIGEDYGPPDDPPLEWVLIGHPKQNTLVKGNYVQGRAYRDGVFKSDTVVGVPRTIERWVYCGASNELAPQ